MSIDTDKFFQMIIERRISDAEKELDTIRTTIPSTELAKGYMKALEGLLLSAKSNDDKYLYMSRIEGTPKDVKALRKEFEAHIANRLHVDYDVGYFQALESYAKKLEHSAPSQEQVDAEKEGRKD